MILRQSMCGGTTSMIRSLGAGVEDVAASVQATLAKVGMFHPSGFTTLYSMCIYIYIVYIYTLCK